MQYHLAQMNIARALDGMESEVMAGFVTRLDEINTLADEAPGFVWRLQDEAGDATNIQAYDEPDLLINMSVWQDLESLQNYVYKSAHVELLKNRTAWFDKLTDVSQVLWWVPAGEIPTVSEGKARLQHLQDYGATGSAFTFSKPFPPGHGVVYC
jgi:hypothetical protein